MRRRLTWSVLAALALASCGERPPSAEDPPPGEGLDAGRPLPGDAGTDGGQIARVVSLSVAPGVLSLTPGEVRSLTATARHEDGSTSDVSAVVEWAVDRPGLVRVGVTAEGTARVEALGAGTARVAARMGSTTSNDCTVVVRGDDGGTDGGSARREYRAVWVTRFAYNSAADVTRIIQQAADAGFNAVFFQIRGNGDAYYQSRLVPWAKRLSGTLGKDPGWDPLQTAITAARARGIELHAYFNAFAAWTVPTGCATAGTCSCTPVQGRPDSCVLPEAVPAGAPEHLLRLHPEYMAVTSAGQSVDTEYYWFSPGNPKVRQHLVEAAEELLTRYDVDGLHLDRIRYPGSGYSYDAASQAEYNALPSPRPAYADWQRENVNKTVGAIYDVVRKHRPRALLSAAVWPIYKVLPGCTTSQGYSGFYQDSVAWMREGKIDALAPMVYWDIGTGCTDWAKLTDFFLQNAFGRHVIAGMYAYDQGVPNPSRLSARIQYARQQGAAGTILFASNFLDSRVPDAGYASAWEVFRADGGPFVEPAHTPPITWR